MPTLIKNCGLKTPKTIATAIRTGASFIGFVHAQGSPRHLALSEIAALMKHVPASTKRVLVLRAPDDALLDAIKTTVKPDFLQLHDAGDAARLSEIRKRFGIPLITAVHVRSAVDTHRATELESVSDHLLFDANEAGSGQSFDWTLLQDKLQYFSFQKPWFLAGGLNPQNVAQAIRITKAPMVDVSSGIESSRGVKSEELIAAFNAAVLNER